MSNGAEGTAAGFAQKDSDLQKFFTDGAKAILLGTPGRLNHPMAQLPAIAGSDSGAAQAGSPGGVLRGWGLAAGVVSGIMNVTSGRTDKQVEGVLQLVGSTSSLGVRVAGSLTAAPTSTLTASLGAAGTFATIAQVWWKAFTGGGSAIQEGVENARREGERLGNLAGFAAGLLAMEPDWVEGYGPIHPTYTGLPSQDRAEDTRIEAFQQAKMAAYAEAMRLPEAEALAILVESLRYAAERGTHRFETRDKWEGLVNLVQRVLPLMANEMEAGTWEFTETSAAAAAPGSSAEAPTAGQSGSAPSTGTAPPSAPTAAPVPAGEVVVVGDGHTLFSIAELALLTAWDRQPTAAEVVAYMTLMIAANLDRLLKPDQGNAGLSGPVVVLPPPPEDPRAAEDPAETDQGAAEEEGGSASTPGQPTDVTGGPDPDAPQVVTSGVESNQPAADPVPADPVPADPVPADPVPADPGTADQQGVDQAATSVDTPAASTTTAEGGEDPAAPEPAHSGVPSAPSSAPEGSEPGAAPAHAEASSSVGASPSGTVVDTDRESPSNQLADHDSGSPTQQLADQPAAAEGLAEPDAAAETDQEQQQQQDQDHQQQQQQQQGEGPPAGG